MKNKPLKTFDQAYCCKCKARLKLNSEFGHLSMDDLSGAIDIVICPSCDFEQNVSPSIEWMTWEEG